ncbi:non-heme iron oxygenase ferredoxin subunit [Flexivirga oryzae]|uniref:3-phenylpropionate/trans-cinnamate dioxygenase ferredoxin subunit n=1 Tax=Flexivirga oryzae TaxID=1794944 RepID=A0A839N729_9MICO|nr:non-heme iron oxygenase ferredoxin subunit [Flexivirga oryzae]MBB2891446.1 3-phenylpropionate/trans-cinnamate dioxygenase ferredoxin subunit [Flexivirga oryzae]
MTDADAVTDEFELVCALDELPKGEPALAIINGVRVAMVLDVEGVVHAVNDTCSHANVSLSEGEVDGCTIECWLHGSRFDLNTGVPTGPPATAPIAVYPVRIKDGDVYVAVPAS